MTSQKMVLDSFACQNFYESFSCILHFKGYTGVGLILLFGIVMCTHTVAYLNVAIPPRSISSSVILHNFFFPAVRIRPKSHLLLSLWQ
jgi:hypothetical protein